MQEGTGTFYIYLAKPLSKVHASNNRSNTDYDPQDILLHYRMINKLGYRKLKLSEKFKRRIPRGPTHIF